MVRDYLTPHLPSCPVHSEIQITRLAPPFKPGSYLLTTVLVQCRSAALLVLSSMLEGSRPYLAAADDKHHCGGLSFTPFSSRLGAVLRELHHQLLLCVNTEAHQVVLTRAIRCLALLVTNTPYHQLSSGYLSRVVATLHSLTQHKGDIPLASIMLGIDIPIGLYWTRASS